MEKGENQILRPGKSFSGDRMTHNNLEVQNVSFKNVSTETTNMSTEGNKKHSCSLCEKSFSSVQALQTHVKKDGHPEIFDNETICDYCGRFFGKQHNLKQHIRNKSRRFFLLIKEYENLLKCDLEMFRREKIKR